MSDLSDDRDEELNRNFVDSGERDNEKYRILRVEETYGRRERGNQSVLTPRFMRSDPEK